MSDLDQLIAAFDVEDPAFIADPYPTLDALREAAPIFWNDGTGQWMLTRFDDVSAALKNRTLGRAYTHRYTHEELGRSGPDSKWTKFNEHERWSLLCLEPPDHTRLRRLVSKVFTPSATAQLADSIQTQTDAAKASIGAAKTEAVAPFLAFKGKVSPLAAPLMGVLSPLFTMFANTVLPTITVATTTCAKDIKALTAIVKATACKAD